MEYSHLRKRSRTEAGHPSPTPENSQQKFDTLLDQINAAAKGVAAILDQEEASATTKSAFDSLAALLNTCATIICSLRESSNRNDAEEQERRRSVVLIGLPESKAERPTQRAKEDEQEVDKDLDVLGVQARPVSVYRMGRFQNPTQGGRPRLIKMVLPASNFQWQVLGGWKRNRDSMRTQQQWNRLLIRPSLSKEDLQREREERAERWRKRNSTTTAATGLNTTAASGSTSSLTVIQKN